MNATVVYASSLSCPSSAMASLTCVARTVTPASSLSTTGGGGTAGAGRAVNAAVAAAAGWASTLPAKRQRAAQKMKANRNIYVGQEESVGIRGPKVNFISYLTGGSAIPVNSESLGDRLGRSNRRSTCTCTAL